MQATDKRKCLQKAHLIKDCYPKYKTQQENNQPTKKCAKDLTETSLGRQAAGKQACRDAPHHISREMQIKTKRCFNLAQAQSTDNASAARTRSSRNPHSLRVGMQRGTATLQHRWAVSYETNAILILLPYGPAILLPAVAPKEPNTCQHKNLHIDVYSSFIHNCLNLEITKIFFSR